MLTKEQKKISKIIAIIEHKAMSVSMSLHNIAERNNGKDYTCTSDYKYNQGKSDVLLDILSEISFIE